MAKALDKLNFTLYAITDGGTKGGNNKDLTDKVRAALDGGLRAIQLREKDLSGRELLRLAERLRRITEDYDAKLFINDRADIAKIVEADGVHLTRNSFTPQDVRSIMGDGKLVGVSTHSLKEARQAESYGADFITLGPIYETPSKLKYGAPIGLEALKEVTAAIDIPIFALGGIKKDNIRDVISAGAKGAGVISAIFSSDNIEETTKELITELKEKG